LLVAAMRHTIVTMPAIPVMACKSVSVTAAASTPSVGSPSKPASDMAMVTRDAQIVRDMYQALIEDMAKLLFSWLFAVVQERSTTSDAGRPGPMAALTWRTVIAIAWGHPPKSAAISAAP